MIIAQITDLHIGFDGPDATCKNTKRLKLALNELSSHKARPDLVLITGDLVENAENWAYKNLHAILDDFDIPCYLTLGNHDDRTAFAQHFPETEVNEGFVQYTIEDGPLRIIVLDTLKPGYHGGAFCTKRAQWLEDRLAEQPERPTLIAMHHPPIETGIAWMTTSKNAGWVKRLKAVLDKYDNVVQIICGHIHRRITQRFSSSLVSVSGAVAPQVQLDLSPLSPDVPDGRVLLVDAPVEFSLYHWDGEVLTSHAGLAPQGRPIVHFDEAHAFIVPHTMDTAKK